MNNQSHDDIIKADPAARRKALLLLISGGLLGVFVIKWGWPLFSDYLGTLPPEKALHILIYVLSFLSIVPFSIGAFMMRRGIQIMKIECFPLPRTKVTKDTRIIRGNKAKRLGKFMIVLSVIFLLCGIFILIFPFELEKSILKRTHQDHQPNKSLKMGAPKDRRTP
jgi:hypothetical protein